MQYIELDKTALLLGVDEKDYYEAKDLFFKNNKEAIIKYLGVEDDTIKIFPDFWYYYLAEYTKNFFHNFESKNYTISIENFIKNNNIELENEIDFEDFRLKEQYYSEMLFDILLSEIKYNLADKNLDIFGINIGFNSNIYYILPKNILKELKKYNQVFAIFDFEKLEEIYGEIYRVVNKLDNENVSIGDYIEKSKNSNEYRTIFNQFVRPNYKLDNINENDIEIVL